MGEALNNSAAEVGDEFPLGVERWSIAVVHQNRRFLQLLTSALLPFPRVVLPPT